MKKFEDWFDIIDSSSLDDLKLELFSAAVRYHHLRNEWYLSEREKRIEIDPSRTRAHNTFIDCCNILSRNMIEAGENADWRKDLGDDRKLIGDFACYVSFRVGVKGR